MTLRITIAWLMLAFASTATVGTVRADPAPTARRATRAGDATSLPREPRAHATATGAQLDDVDKTLGPFSLGGRDYTVVVHSKRLTHAAPGVPDDEALAALDIRDPSGTVVHHETFEYSLDDHDFASSCSVSAELLKGSMINALLIDVGCEPSAPQGGSTWEIFGVWNGTFSRLGRPFTTQGALVRFIAGAVTKLGQATSFQPDVIELRVWTGSFHVVVPLTMSWTQGQLVPPRCYAQSGHGMREGGCELQVTVERTPVDDELTFVRLFAEANEAFGVPKHVVVKRDSQVDFLGASVRIVMSGADVVEVGVADDPWLHVRIDGREGWLHTAEDLAAIGVPQAG